MKRVLRGRTPADLIVAAFANEGVRPLEGESRVKFLNSLYDISVDTERNQYVARRKEPA